MANSPSRILDRFRRPEYTGQNRCLPCTAVNLVLALCTATGTAAIVWVYRSPLTGILLGHALFLLFVAGIYFRGYLVPGTPWFTRTYFPERVLRWFDKEAAARDVTPTQEVDVERTLLQAGAVTECEREDDLCLTDEFRTAWRDRIADLRESDTGREELATVMDVAPDRLSFQEYDDAFVALLDNRHAGQWESHAAFLADIAAARVLRPAIASWDDIDVHGRSQILNSLRLFLERCPACDGRVSVDQEVVESCCRSIDVVAVTCQDCGVRLFEAEQP